MVRPGNPNLCSWWDVFEDPIMTRLVHEAAVQNLTVRQAAIQIDRARIQRNIAMTELLPQAQTAEASYTHGVVSRNNGAPPSAGAVFGTGLTPSASSGFVSTPTTPIAGLATPVTGAGSTVTGTGSGVSGIAGGAGGGSPTGDSRFFNNWAGSLNFAWELDFWGLFRRNLEAANANLDQAAENRDAIMVQLLATVSQQYVEFRTLQKRLELARQNVAFQEPLVSKLKQQYDAGIANSKPAYYQLKSNLDATRAIIPTLEIALRQANNQICVLLGLPVRDLTTELGDGLDRRDPSRTAVRIPRAKDDTVALGIPADILLQRPDVVAAERQLRIQSAQIGIAEAEMYPHVGINGSIGLAANRLDRVFNQQSLIGSIGPSMAWNIFNYGRLLANVRSQNLQYQEFVLVYQQTILNANQDAENALVAYLDSLERAKRLQDSADAAVEVTKYFYTQLAEGYLPPAATSVSFYNQIFTAVNFQVNQQDLAAQAEGDVALNLILLYRALGGGWQINGGGNCAPSAATAPTIAATTAPANAALAGAPAAATGGRPTSQPVVNALPTSLPPIGPPELPPAAAVLGVPVTIQERP